MNHPWRLITLALLAAAPVASAYELADGKLNLGGFGQAAAALNDRNGGDKFGSSFAIIDPSFTMFVTAQPIEQLFLSVQVDLNPSQLNLDWVFAEWRFSDALHLRLGKVKQPFGLLGETRDVGTLRPFFHPAAVAYRRGTELSADGVIGFGVNGRADSQSGAWALSYDLYGGQLQLASNDMLDQLAGRAPLIAGGTIHPVTEYNTALLGGRLWLTTPLEGLSVVASGYASFFTSDTEKIGKDELKLAGGLGVEYLTERWMVRSELFFLYHENDMRRTAAYLEVGYFITPHIEPALRGEISQVANFGAKASDAQFFRHREVAAALNYWFNRSMVVRLEYHYTNGNLLDYPEAFADAYLAHTVSPNTNAVLLGSQFSF